MERMAEGAIELNDNEVFHNCSYSCYANLADALNMLRGYEDTGLTPEQVQELKEKQIPKKPFINDYSLTCCPNCHGIEVLAGCESIQLNYCNQCGQKLDWE